ncbi:MAG: hypothetical protein ACFFD2_12285 [Promethearchaeota archaeon]
MNVKGIAFLTGKKSIILRYGEERWNNFFKLFKESHPEFPDLILPTTKIPIKPYIKLQDAMVKEFNKGNKKVYWKYGEKAAKLTMTKDGPFSIFLKKKRTPEAFITYFLPRMWNLFFDEGLIKYKLEGNTIDLYILDLPKYYIYLEYINMGFIQKALELSGISVNKTIKITSSAKKIHYKFVLDL